MVLGLLGGLTVGEILVRVFNVGPRFEPVAKANYQICQEPSLRYGLVPGSEYLGTRFNTAGMRDRERSFAKPPGVYRVACIGDSITLGLYVPQRENFASRLEEMLIANPPSPGVVYEVLNFGVTGYNIAQSAANLTLHAMKYAPDLVIYSYCLNDPSEYSLEFSALRNGAGRVDRRYLDEVILQPQEWAGHLRLYRLARYAWFAESDAWGRCGATSARFAAPAVAEWDDEILYRNLHGGADWDRVPEGFKAIAQATSPVDVPVVVVLFPLLNRLTDYPLGDVHEKVRTAAEHEGLRVLDLLKPFQQAASTSSEPLASDNLHPTAHGHAVAAEAMFEALSVSAALREGLE